MPRSRTRTKVVIAVCAVLLVAAAAVPAAYLIRGRLAEQHFRDAASGFAAAWRSGRLETVAYRGTTGADVAKQAATITAGLTPAAKDTPSADKWAPSASGSPGGRTVGAGSNWRGIVASGSGVWRGGRQRLRFLHQHQGRERRQHQAQRLRQAVAG